MMTSLLSVTIFQHSQSYKVYTSKLIERSAAYGRATQTRICCS